MARRRRQRLVAASHATDQPVDEAAEGAEPADAAPATEPASSEPEPAPEVAAEAAAEPEATPAPSELDVGEQGLAALDELDDQRQRSGYTKREESELDPWDDNAPRSVPDDLGQFVTRAGDLPTLFTRQTRTVSNPIAAGGVAVGALGVLLLLFGVYELAGLVAVVGAGAGYIGMRFATTSSEHEGHGVASAALLLGVMVILLSGLGWYTSSSGEGRDKHGAVGSTDESTYGINDKHCGKGNDGRLAFSGELENKTDQVHGFKVTVAFTRNGDQVAPSSVDVSGLSPGDVVGFRVTGPDANLATGCEVTSVIIIS